MLRLSLLKHAHLRAKRLTAGKPALNSLRVFSTQQVRGLETVSDLEAQALKIQQNIDAANENIERQTKEGLQISREIAQEIVPDKFPKMQRYNMFIAKMEQLAAMESLQ